jgi:Trypsin-co-occurring domain 1
MFKKLIRLRDGTLVEVEIPDNQPQKTSGIFSGVNATFEQIKPILIRVCKPIAAAWEEISQDVDIDRAEVSIGISFEGEGNLYITKSKASANLTVKLIIKPNKIKETKGENE